VLQDWIIFALSFVNFILQQIQQWMKVLDQNINAWFSYYHTGMINLMIITMNATYFDLKGEKSTFIITKISPMISVPSKSVRF